jgi:hypothetical protein
MVTSGKVEFFAVKRTCSSNHMYTPPYNVLQLLPLHFYYPCDFMCFEYVTPNCGDIGFSGGLGSAEFLKIKNKKKI